MNYLYHRVPKEMRGDVLFPLNVLKDKFPEAYAKEVGKYKERQHIMEQRIPFLDCLWNDVLHFCAVHPSLLKQALNDVGEMKSYDLSFYEVDPKLLAPENTIVYLFVHKNHSPKMNESNFIKFDPDDISKYSEFPQITSDYYREMVSKGTSPLLFHGIPHVLFRGSLDIKGLNKIRW